VTNPGPLVGERAPRRVVFLAVTALGISSIVTQLVLMRELFAVYSGNELVLGIVLGVWLLMTGLGATVGVWLSRARRLLTVLFWCQLAVALLPIGTLVAVRVLRDQIFVRGAELGLHETLTSTAALLLPYCLVAGGVLTLASQLLGSDDPASVGSVYLADNVGDIAGGLLFSAVLVYVAGHVDALVLIAVLNLAAAAAVAWFARRPALVAVALGVGLATGGAHLAIDADRLTLAIQHHGARIVHHAYSAQGHVVVTERGGQLDFVESGVVLCSSEERAHAERVAHLALAERPRARRVLLVGGGVSGSARELLRWPVGRVDYVELDPELLVAARRYLPDRLADPRLSLRVDDGRRFIQRTPPGSYDVVILDLPDPVTTQLNRFYTEELFREVRAALIPDGLLALSIGHYENYVSDELAALLSTVHRTLRGVFPHVLVLPLGDVTMLASAGPLATDVVTQLAAELDRAGIAPEWTTPAELAADLTPDRRADIERALVADGPVNRDLSPVLYFQAIRAWLSRSGSSFAWAPPIVVALLAVYLVRAGPVPTAIFAAGFGAAALEVVVLVAFQVVHGFVYRQLGLIITVFLVGLAVGAYAANRWLGGRARTALLAVLGAAAVGAVALPFVLQALVALGEASGESGAAAWVNTAAAWGRGALGDEARRVVSAFVVFPGLVLALGALVGAAFPLAARVDFRGASTTAARLYTADFLGAATGALLVSTLALPRLGVSGVCWATAALCALAAGLVYTSRAAASSG
jgi:spermidine synthase